MPNFRRVQERVAERILGSEHTLTLEYGRARVTPAGIAPLALPVAPLVAIPSPTRPAEEEPETVRGAISMPCLYTELSQLGEARRQKLQVVGGTWSHEAIALVRVRAEDLERPEGGLYLEGAETAQVNGMRFRVLGWSQSGATVATGGTYYVQLGAGQ